MAGTTDLSDEMKGTVQNLNTKKTYVFEATEFQLDNERRLRIRCNMVDPEGSEDFQLAGIGLELRDENVGDGDRIEIPYPSARIYALNYARIGGAGGTRIFEAKSGAVEVRHQLPEDRIKGRLEFVTDGDGDDEYAINVTYNIGARR